MCSLSGKMLIFFSLSRSVSLDLVSGHIEAVRRTATRTSLLACVCFIIRLRWSLEHFSVDCRKLLGVALVSSSSLSYRSRKNSRHFLSQSDKKLQPIVTWSQVCIFLRFRQFAWVYYEFSSAVWVTSLSSDWLSCYYGFNLQYLIEMRSKVFWLFFVVLLSQRNHYYLSSKYELFLA